MKNMQPIAQAVRPLQHSAGVGSAGTARRLRLKETEERLAALRSDLAELHSALFQAAQVHRHLCAPRLVRRGELEIASEIFAVRHLSGDFITLAEREDAVFLALGDISGKGLAAGMWTVHLAGLLRVHTLDLSDPAEIVAAVNHDLCRLQPTATLTSLFLARVDIEGGRLTYSSAGHPPALLLRADGGHELLQKGGTLLGVLPHAVFATGEATLMPGDLLVVCSDGLLECRNLEDQDFALAGLGREAHRARSLTTEAAVFSILGAVQDFAAGRSPHDDMSLLAIRRHGRPGVRN